MSDIALIFVILSIVTSNILCFLFGAKTAQKVAINEPIKTELSKIKSPMQIYKEKEEQKEYEKEIEDLRKSLVNIDNYGSEIPQQEI